MDEETEAQGTTARSLLQETVSGLDALISCVTLGKGPHLLNFKEGGGETGNENECEACCGQDCQGFLHGVLHPQDTPWRKYKETAAQRCLDT